MPIGASVMGESHKTLNVECQDSFSFLYDKEKKWLAITVCDGAGSSKNSSKSSKYVSEQFSRELILIASHLSKKPFGQWVTDSILQAILSIREKLRSRNATDDLSDYHTTLVSVLLGPPDRLGGRSGITIHIGDGAVIGGKIGSDIDNDQYILDEDFYILSEPQNGEYANETYFLTETKWIKNIRLDPIGELDWIAIATDGGTAALLNGDNALRSTFLPKVFQDIVSANTQQASEILNFHLTSPDLNQITDDDKTIIVVFDQNKNLSDLKYIVSKSHREDEEQTSSELFGFFPKDVDHENQEIRSAFRIKKPRRHVVLLIIGILALTSIIALLLWFGDRQEHADPMINTNFLSTKNEMMKLKEPATRSPSRPLNDDLGPQMNTSQEKD